MRNWWWKILIGLVLIGAVTAAVFFYIKYRDLSGNKDQRETENILNKVGKLMVLPDELPTIATVTDKTKLEGQKFFKNTVNGDKVLIFTLASKAILYRPSKNIIVEVASVQSSDNNAIPVAKSSVTPSAGMAKTYKVVLLNGTGVVGTAAKLEKLIKNSSLEITTGNADGTDYLRTIAINTGKIDSNDFSQIAGNLGAKEMDNLPTVETVSGYDVVIIVGKDKL